MNQNKRLAALPNKKIIKKIIKKYLKNQLKKDLMKQKNYPKK